MERRPVEALELALVDKVVVILEVGKEEEDLAGSLEAVASLVVDKEVEALAEVKVSKEAHRRSLDKILSKAKDFCQETSPHSSSLAS